MHGQRITRRDLSRRGDKFLLKIAGLGLHYSDLATVWKRPCLADKIFADSRTANAVGASPTGVQGFAPRLGDGYLLVEPQMGLSNQLTAIEHSAIMARALGRKLVLPHFFLPHPSDEHADQQSWTPFHAVFDPTGVEEVLPGLDYVYADIGMLGGVRPARILVTEPKPIFDNLHEVYSESFGWSGANRIDMLSYFPQLDSEDKIYQGLGSCGDDLMVLNGLYKAPFRDRFNEAFRLKLWATLFRPAPLVKHIILKVGDAISGSATIETNATQFGCLHVRLGDFSKVCSAPSNTVKWLSDMYANGRHCNVPSDAVVARANSMKLNKVVILSDDPAKLAPILDGITASEVWTSADIRAMIEGILPQIHPHPTKHFIDVVSAVTEQHVCAAAHSVVLNDFSTFSRSVRFHRRKREGVEFW